MQERTALRNSPDHTPPSNCGPRMAGSVLRFQWFSFPVAPLNAEVRSPSQSASRLICLLKNTQAAPCDHQSFMIRVQTDFSIPRRRNRLTDESSRQVRAQRDKTANSWASRMLIGACSCAIVEVLPSRLGGGELFAVLTQSGQDERVDAMCQMLSPMSWSASSRTSSAPLWSHCRSARTKGVGRAIEAWQNDARASFFIRARDRG